MAAAHNDDDDKAPPFRCLDAARLVVAAAMTVLIVAVIAYAVTVVLRPGELSLWVIGGSVSVKRSSTDDDNGTVAKLWARNSSGHANSFLGVRFRAVALAPQLTVDSDVLLTTAPATATQEYYFQKLGRGDSIDGAWLVLSGTRTVENYAGHNMTAVQAVYHCSPLVVGGDQEDSSKVDALCTENPPTAASL